MINKRILSLILILAAFLFGPKIGVIDLSILFLIIFTSIYFAITKKLVLSREAIFLYTIGIIALGWTLLIFMFSENSDVYPVARTLRAFISTVIGFALIYSISRRYNYSEKELLHAVCLVLSLNAIVVLLQIIIPETQQLFSQIWGFDKKFASYRAFGLTAGYDTAGYLNVIGFVTAILLKIKSNEYKYNYLIALFFISTLLTSRSSMALLLFTSIMILFYSFYKFDIKKRYLFIPIILLFIIAKYIVIPIFMSTFGGGGLLNNSFLLEVATNYSSTDIEKSYSALWYFPFGINLIIGVGQNIASDVGYVMIVWMNGLVMLFLALVFYIVPVLYVYHKKKSINHSYIYFLLVFVTFVIIVGNLKNLYFFSRNYHELYIAIAATYFAVKNKSLVTKKIVIKSIVPYYR